MICGRSALWWSDHMLTYVHWITMWIIRVLTTEIASSRTEHGVCLTTLTCMDCPWLILIHQLTVLFGVLLVVMICGRSALWWSNHMLTYVHWITMWIIRVLTTEIASSRTEHGVCLTTLTCMDCPWLILIHQLTVLFGVLLVVMICGRSALWWSDHMLTYVHWITMWIIRVLTTEIASSRTEHGVCLTTLTCMDCSRLILIHQLTVLFGVLLVVMICGRSALWWSNHMLTYVHWITMWIIRVLTTEIASSRTEYGVCLTTLTCMDCSRLILIHQLTVLFGVLLVVMICGRSALWWSNHMLTYVHWITVWIIRVLTTEIASSRTEHGVCLTTLTCMDCPWLILIHQLTVLFGVLLVVMICGRSALWWSDHMLTYVHWITMWIIRVLTTEIASSRTEHGVCLTTLTCMDCSRLILIHQLTVLFGVLLVVMICGRSALWWSDHMLTYVHWITMWIIRVLTTEIASSRTEHGVCLTTLTCMDCPWLILIHQLTALFGVLLVVMICGRSALWWSNHMLTYVHWITVWIIRVLTTEIASSRTEHGVCLTTLTCMDCPWLILIHQLTVLFGVLLVVMICGRSALWWSNHMLTYVHWITMWIIRVLTTEIASSRTEHGVCLTKIQSNDCPGMPFIACICFLVSCWNQNAQAHGMIWLKVNTEIMALRVNKIIYTVLIACVANLAICLEYVELVTQAERAKVKRVIFASTSLGFFQYLNPKKHGILHPETNNGQTLLKSVQSCDFLLILNSSWRLWMTGTCKDR